MKSHPTSDATIKCDADRKARGAFFTPPAIAEFLASWAIADQLDARVLDPASGDGAFLQAAGSKLRALGHAGPLDEQLYGIEVHRPSLKRSSQRLRERGLAANLHANDFFDVEPPDNQLSQLPTFDAVIGNPPYVRYQQHTGEARKASLAAALRQGVRLTGLTSSWAPLLVHAASFLGPDGRLGMVLPAELLTVGYAEPIRRWLRTRFAAVKLIIFEKLQFDDVLENVVLLMSHGSGGCDAFSIYFVENAEDLSNIQPCDEFAVTPSTDSNWTDLLLGTSERQLFQQVVGEYFAPLGDYASVELGTVTGANHYFTLTEGTRVEYQLEEGKHVQRISPPGTRHLRGLTFTRRDWIKLRDSDERVWMLCPEETAEIPPVAAYIRHGEEIGVPTAYKCKIRTPWWKPPMVSPPDTFFTYMSHRFPRLIANRAGVSFVNSMHGLRFNPVVQRAYRDALPLIALNSVSMLGAEVYGRSYGGGVLKMEPREAAALPVPRPEIALRIWEKLRSERDSLNRQLRNGLWTNAIARVDEVLLRDIIELTPEEASTLTNAARTLRARRLSRNAGADDSS